MAKVLRDGQLSGIIRSEMSKLICVDFGNPGCPPCQQAKPFWESLPSKYKTCLFFFVICNDCPSTAQEHNVHSTPTFIFFLKGKKVAEVVGFNQSKIISTIERYKSSGGFSGSAKVISKAPTQDVDDFLARITTIKGDNSKPVMECNGDSCKLIARSEDPEVRKLMREMGFSMERIVASLAATNNGSLEDCVQWLAEQDKKGKQKKLEGSQESPIPHQNTDVNPIPKPNDANDTIAMKNELTDMGFPKDIIEKALEQCKGQPIDQIIEFISIVQDSQKDEGIVQEPLTPKPEKPSTPNININEDVMKDEGKLEGELQKMETQRSEENITEDAMHKKEEKVIINNLTQRSASTPAVLNPIPTTVTLQLVFPNNFRKVYKFNASDTLFDVEKKIQEENTSPQEAIFDSIIPRAQFQRTDYGKTLIELGLAPRSQIGVRF